MLTYIVLTLFSLLKDLLTERIQESRARNLWNKDEINNILKDKGTDIKL